MKLYCKVASLLALCLGLLLLLYLFVGSSSDGEDAAPPSRPARGSPPALLPSGPRRDPRLARQAPLPPIAAAQVSKREQQQQQPRLHRKAGRRSGAREKLASERPLVLEYLSNQTDAGFTVAAENIKTFCVIPREFCRHFDHANSNAYCIQLDPNCSVEPFNRRAKILLGEKTPFAMTFECAKGLKKLRGGKFTDDYSKNYSYGRPNDQKLPPARSSALQWMHLAVVACGDRLEETLIMLKSAVLFSNKKLKFHIFAEDSLKPEFERKLQEWPPSYTKKFEYHVYPIFFSVGNAQEWRKLFKPCAAQRLFLPMILKDVDSLLYVDTDVLFLRPIDDLWGFLKAFNSTQLAAMAPEHEIPKIGWYSRFARHPYYGTTGVNSGVMLMNLTRIRNTQFKNSMIPTGLTWEEMLYPLYQKYKNYITWGDQDLLNIIFYFNPECIFLFPCQWNYRPDHCMYGSNCRGAEEEGISILHGNRGVYHDDKQPTFKALYEVIRDFSFEDNLFQSMYYPLQTKFLDTVHTLCGRIPQVFLKQIERTMKKVYENRVIVNIGANFRL